MCENFGVIQRQMVGRTLCERIGDFLDSLSPADKEQVERRASRYDDDPNLKLAIDSMIRVGTFYEGTNAVTAQALSARGLQGTSFSPKWIKPLSRQPYAFIGLSTPAWSETS